MELPASTKTQPEFYNSTQTTKPKVFEHSYCSILEQYFWAPFQQFLLPHVNHTSVGTHYIIPQPCYTLLRLPACIRSYFNLFIGPSGPMTTWDTSDMASAGHLQPLVALDLMYRS
jgi:hypothetical protein